MAPAEESAFFPSLHSCLDGSPKLLSWKTVASELSQSSSQPLEKDVLHHIQDSTAIRALTRCFGGPPPPSSESKAEFETLTSAINITPTSNGRYDINRLKEDTLWLSKEVSIDEVSALRLTVLEWQSRQAERLLQADSLDATDNLGTDKLNNSIQASLLLSPGALAKTVQHVPSYDFDSLEARRSRLLRIFMSELQFLLQSVEHLVTRAVTLVSESKSNAHSDSVRSAKDAEEVGLKILKSWHVAEGWSDGSKAWFNQLLSFLELRLESLGRESGWRIENEPSLGLEQQWSNANMLRILSTLQISLAVSSSSSNIASSRVVLDWFRSMDRLHFLETPNIVFSDLSASHIPYLQYLVVMNSLSFVQLHQVMVRVPELSSASTPTNGPGDSINYLQDVACVEEVTRILLGAAMVSVDTATLTIFAWCILLQTIREHASSSTEIKELRQSQKAIENYGTVQQSEPDSVEGGLGRRRPSPVRRPSLSSDGSQQTTLFEDIVEAVQRIEPNDDIVQRLADWAVGQVFQIINAIAQMCSQIGCGSNQGSAVAVRGLLLDLVRSAKTFIDYSDSFMESLFSIMLGNDTWKMQWWGAGKSNSVDYQNRFLRGDILLSDIFNEALGRFPYESVPFVKLCRALTPYQQPRSKEQEQLIDILTSTSSFTSLLAEPDVPYELGGDGENISLKLTSPINVMLLAFPSLRAVTRFLLLPGTFEVPEETMGRALSDSKPIVVFWSYKYSAIRFFGLVLQNTLELRSEFQIAPSHTLFELSTEIVGFLTTWLHNLSSSSASVEDGVDPQDLARKVLEEASDSMSRNEDAIAIILDLLEGELYKQHSSSQDAESSRFITWGIRFLSVLTTVIPSRVWPFLGRSGLLGLNGTESKLIGVVVAVELPSGEFSALLSSLDLFEVLIEDAISSSVSKKAISKALKRFSSSDADATGAGVSETMMRSILLQFMRILMDIFQSSGTWRITRVEERLELNTRICKIFDNVLSLCYIVDDENELEAKLTNSLASSATYLVDTYLSAGPNGPTLQPLLQLLVSGLQTPFDTTTSYSSELWQAQTIAAIDLTTTLLRLNKFLKRPTSSLCGQVFGAITVVAKLHVTHPRYCVPVLNLLEATVIDAGSSDKPPSLLGHLGQSTAKSFLDCLSTFGRPNDNSKPSVATWKLLAAIVSQRQQWLAVYLLTGRTPRETITNNCEARAPHSNPIIKIALSKLSRLSDIPPVEALAMLEFIALAADYWEPIALQIRDDQACKEACLKFISGLKPANALKHTQSEHDISQYQIAAYIVSILALLVHHSNEKRDVATLRHIVPCLGYLTEHGVASPSYNASLHHSLRRNFEARFQGCSLANFKRTSFSRPTLGPVYYYDSYLAGRMLRHNAGWKGKSNRGTENEFSRANLNLSVVETQIKLFHSWKSLAMQLSEGLAGDREFQKTIASIARDCLQANLDNTLPETVFEKLATSRVDLAFTLLQRLIEVAPFGYDAKTILDSAWALLRNQGSDIATVLSGNNASYYRNVLKVLYLSLQVHVSSERPRLENQDHGQAEQNALAKKTKKIEATVLEILETVVAHGFRSLIVLLHEDSNKVEPSDFTLLIVIMRTALRIPGVATYSERLITFFDDERTAQYASTLLSWSDQLATDGDPIYGELSMTFLLELSNLPTLAESLVVSGTFAQATTTNLLNWFRKPGGHGPFDEPRRLYNIWARGFLPIVINLLSAVGPPIAAELSTTLNQFEAQLSRASHSLGVKLSPVSSGANAGYVTLSMANEIHALALITTILHSFRESGPSLGIVASELVELPWDSAGVREDLETRLQRRNNLRNNIVPTDEHEEALSRQKPSNAQGGCENRLEEKVVEELTAALSLLGNTEL